jgi:hypothetical protein
MTLSQAVCAFVAEYFSAEFAAEMRLGQANQVDFSGKCVQVGNIRIELERRREDPVNNVAKAWRQANENPSEPPFTLVHVFSGFYSSKSSKRAKMDNARFVGEKMCAWAQANNRGIRYVAVFFDYEPLPAGGDPILPDTIANRIRDQIFHQLQGLIPKPT